MFHYVSNFPCYPKLTYEILKLYKPICTKYNQKRGFGINHLALQNLESLTKQVMQSHENISNFKVVLDGQEEGQNHLRSHYKLNIEQILQFEVGNGLFPP